MRKFLLSTLTILLFLSCNRQDQTQAHIFERKSLANDSLLIYYTFRADTSVIRDSAFVQEDTVIHDTIQVEFERDRPSQSRILK